MPNGYVDPNDPTRRQPYQYQPQSQPPKSPYGEPTIPAQPGQYKQNGQRRAYNQPGQQGYYNQSRPQTPIPTTYPDVQQGSWPQRKRRRRKGCMFGCLGALAVLIAFVVLASMTVSKALAFGSAISSQAPLSTGTGYMTTSQRTNLLIMGYGGGGHDGAYLTDSLVVISLIPQTGHTSLVSVPRDLWVPNPYEGQGVFTKINAIYSDASQNNTKPVAGGDAAVQQVQTVTGLNTQYWLTIDFSGFQEFIDSIGGITVNVPDAFTANYPANDDPAVNASWTTIHFDKGVQQLDGKRAIQYARARYVTDNPAEDSDFARSIRQQIIIKAALAKVKSISTWPKLLNALTALQKTIYTNMSLADLAGFALKMDLNNPQTARIGLSVDNVMAYSTSSDGQSIVIPQDYNWQADYDWQSVKDYVQQHLYA